MTEVAQQLERTPRQAVQWIGVLAAPIAWAVQLQAAYSFSRFACSHPWCSSAHHATSAGTFIIAVIGAIIAWSEHSRLSRQLPEETAEPEESVTSRARFMAWLGVITSVLFALVIVAQWLPTIFIDPCWY
jgi:hypothetical protein